MTVAAGGTETAEDISDAEIFAVLPESPPKEEKRPRTRRSEPRSSSGKRALSTPPAIPPGSQRRGRSGHPHATAP